MVVWSSVIMPRLEQFTRPQGKKEYRPGALACQAVGTAGYGIPAHVAGRGNDPASSHEGSWLH